MAAYSLQQIAAQDIMFGRFYNSPVGDNPRLRSTTTMLGMQLGLVALQLWMTAQHASGELLHVLGKVNALSWVAWTAYFLISKSNGNKAGWSDSGFREGLIVCGGMAILNGMTFFM